MKQPANRDNRLRRKKIVLWRKMFRNTKAKFYTVEYGNIP